MLTLIDRPAFLQAIQDNKPLIPLFKQALTQATIALEERFKQDESVINLVQLRASFVDFLLSQAWQHFIPTDRHACLVAVGGYGRHELHPSSDIDLLILLETDKDESLNENLSQLITFFWDIGLEIGQSVRTVEECTREASKDITVITNLIEARKIIGNEQLCMEMQSHITSDKIWSSAEFFKAKQSEQEKRHNRYDATAYNLEPNIKENPGGLRDIQTIGWIAKRHFNVSTFAELVTHNFLTQAEHDALMTGQQLLWKIRYALHILSKRREDRLVFNYQHSVARIFGFHEQENNQGIEMFMQQYYRTVMMLGRINERLLALFEEDILLKNKPDIIEPLDQYFQIKNGFIRTNHDDVFEQHPLGLLEIFLHFQNHPNIKGIGAKTSRLIRENLPRIDQSFRQMPAANACFMAIFRAPQGLTHALRRMNQFGVLSAYLPDFENIVGRMQYDLFHVYTVDEHTLFVVRNLRRFMINDFHHEFALCSDIITQLAKPELTYFAGLFHDIAKGRGGDHAELGETIARTFCQQHGLADEDSELVAWLVRQHLIMSMTAQRKDISDPEVILEFGQKVKTIKRLNYLYLLTVADMRATDPKKWNSWKDSLLKQLYYSTKQALIRGLQDPIKTQTLIDQTQKEALTLLLNSNLSRDAIHTYWQGLTPEYFIQFPASSIAWHTQQVIHLTQDQLPFVNVCANSEDTGAEIIVYSQDRPYLFGLITQALDQLGLNIVNARIASDKDGHSLDSFQVIAPNNQTAQDPQQKQDIINRLYTALAQTKTETPSLKPYRSRQLEHFNIPTELDYCRDPSGLHTIMKLTTADRPGLLALVGSVFKHCGIQLHQAKITTLGASAEDTFFITNTEGKPLKKTEQYQCLQKNIFEYLEH